eukprot:c28328_g1_i1 orf=371-1933(+)
MQINSEILQLASVCVVILFSLWWFVAFYSGNGKRPRGPLPLPLLGHAHLMYGSLPHQALSSLSKRYGPLLHLRFGSTRSVVVSSACLAKEVLKTQDVNTAQHFRSYAQEIFSYGFRDIVGCPYDDHWRKMRRMLVSELLSPRRQETFKHIRMEEIRIIEEFLLQQEKEGVDRVNMKTLSLQYTFNILTRMLMSVSFFGPQSKNSKVAYEFRETVREVITLLGTPNIGDFVPALKRLDLQGYQRQIRKAAKRADIFLQSLIDERRAKRERDGKHDESNDYLDTMLLSLPPGSDSDNIIKAVWLDLFSAGTDTSAATLEWALTRVVRDPRILSESRKELDREIGLRRKVEETDIPNLVYLHAVLKETLRLHPAVPLLLHTCYNPCAVGGYPVHDGSFVIVNLVGLHRDANVFERSEEFYPERFLDWTNDTNGNMQYRLLPGLDVSGHNFEYIPFGSGRRGCPAMQMGMATVQLALARLLHTFDFFLPEGERPEEISLKESNYGVTLTKALPLQLRPVARFKD